MEGQRELKWMKGSFPTFGRHMQIRLMSSVVRNCLQPIDKSRFPV